VDGERVITIFAGQEQEIFQLAAKEFGPRRVIESQRGERFEDAEAAGVSPVLGLDADDGNDDFGRDAVDRFGALQEGTVLFPEAQTTRFAAAVDEALAVAFPGALLAGASSVPRSAACRGGLVDGSGAAPWRSSECWQTGCSAERYRSRAARAFRR